MVFSSIVFLFLFLPVVLFIYFTIGKKFRNIFLTFASLCFYYWGENYLIWIMLLSTVVDYFSALIITNGFKGEIKQLDIDGRRTMRQKLGILLSLTVNLSLLGYFKYSNFFVDSFIATYTAIGIHSDILKSFGHVALPLGISFYTFQTMSYTLDVYFGNVKATRNFINFICYVSLFPQLVAGPIVRYQDIQFQLDNHSVNLRDYSAGMLRFVIGLAKKVIIANSVGQVADSVFAMPNNEITFSLAWIGVIAYTIQIYFDFSGYSDMAIGLGMIFGFRFLENFNYPYIARSIQDFWRRWHISLSTWWRDYLYIPLGGSRVSPFRTYVNLFIVFFLCGLWHGAKWTFVFWGLYQGIFLIIERAGFSKILKKLPTSIQHFYAIIIFMFGWVIFRSESMAQIKVFAEAMFSLSHGFGFSMFKEFNSFTITAMVLGILFSVPFYPYITSYYGTLRSNHGTSWLVFDIAGYAALFAVFLFCVMSLSSNTYNPFIYYRF